MTSIIVSSSSSLKCCFDLISKKKFDHYVPGHGKAGGQEILLNYKNYLNNIFINVKKLYAQGIADFEMKKTIGNSVAKYKSWDNYEMLLGPNISRAYLEVEAEEFQ